MFETINHYAVYLEQASLLSYPISLFLGFLAGMAAITCFLPIIPMVMGFVGGQEITRKRLLIVPLYIMAGSIIVLGLLGVIVSFAGLTLQTYLGPYWNYFAGGMCVMVGFVELQLLKLPSLNLPELKHKGFWSSLLFGMLAGGTIAMGSSCCVPALPIVLTYAGIRANPIHGGLVLAAFAIGQGIPVFAIGLFSSVLGKSAAKWSFYIHKSAGVLLIIVGMYIFWK